jgi:hypothetical protein
MTPGKEKDGMPVHETDPVVVEEWTAFLLSQFLPRKLEFSPVSG